MKKKKTERKAVLNLQSEKKLKRVIKRIFKIFARKANDFLGTPLKRA